MKRLPPIFLLLLGLFTGLNAVADRMFFAAGTPVRDRPDPTAPVQLVLPQDAELEVAEVSRTILQNNLIGYDVLMYRVDSGGSRLWLTPSQRVVNGRIKAVDPDRTSSLVVIWVNVLLGIAVASAYFPARRRYPPEKFRWAGPALLILSLLIFHFAWLRYLSSTYPGAFQTPTDEGEYFRIAACLLRGDFSRPFGYTLGYPLFCMPFVYFFGGSGNMELARTVGQFSAVVMMPVSITLVFLLLMKIAASAWRAYVALLLLLVLPKLFLAVEFPYTAVLFSPLGSFHSEYIFLAYQFCLTGFNALSEWISLPLVFGTMAIAVYCRPGAAKYAILGVLFGLAVLVRMNNVLLAPVTAALCWYADRDALRDRRTLLKLAITAVLCATVVAIWQPVVNYLQLGSPFRTPYSLHQEYGQERFGVQYLPRISWYYFQIHLIILAPAIAGMFFIRDAARRNLLVLWTIPTLLFFFCFNFMGHPHRFFLSVFPGLSAGLICAGVWERDISRGRRIALALLMIFLALPVLPLLFEASLPSFQFSRANLMASAIFWRLVLAIPALAAALWYFRRKRELVLFTLLYAALITAYGHWLMIAAMLFLLGQALFRLASDVWRTVAVSRQPAAETAQGPE